LNNSLMSALRTLLMLFLAAMSLAGCAREIDYPEPSHSTQSPEFPDHLSVVDAPVSFPLTDIRTGLERVVPTTLYRIDERRDNCVPPQRISVFGERIRLTPDVRCRIVGDVERGRLTIAGGGDSIEIGFPVTVVVSAEEIAGIIDRETATGKANVRLRANVSLDQEWNPHAKIDIAYDWTSEPGVEILGQRIRFARQVDQQLRPIIAKLEQELEKQISRTRVRERIERVWQGGFANLQVNRERPPVWLRLTPQAMALRGFTVEGGNLVANVQLQARVRTYVGEEPTAEKPAPLPDQIPLGEQAGLELFVPVLAQYSQLEPILLRELSERTKQGLNLPGVGAVTAEIDDVTIYATEENRIAVGITARLESAEEDGGLNLGKVNGRIWLVGIPYNDPNSAEVEIRDLAIFGDTDRMTTDLLFRYFNSDEMRRQVEQSLTANFDKDLENLLGRVRIALTDLRADDWRIAVQIDEIQHGRLQATADGLYLPVEVKGSARASFDDRPQT
jgi:hypothetical protein